MVPAQARVPCEGASPPHTPPLREFLEAAADVVARTRCAVAVDEEQAAVGVLVVVATNAEARERRVEVPVIARIRRITAARSSRIKHREPSRSRYVKRRRITAARRTDARTAAAVAEIGRIQDKIHTTTVVVTAVHPVVAVTPQVFNISVLRTHAVSRAGRLHCAGMIWHTVGRTHILYRTVVAAAVPDFRLRVPVGELHDIEQPDGEAHRKIHLPDVRAKPVNRRTRIGTGDADFRPLTGYALIAGRTAVIAPDVDDIPFASPVSTVHVRGRYRESSRFLVGDLNFHSAAALGDFVPELWNCYHNIAGTGALSHTRPRLQVIERRAVA